MHVIYDVLSALFNFHKMIKSIFNREKKTNKTNYTV